METGGWRGTSGKESAGLVSVVDDDISVLRSLGNLFASVGFPVETFGSAEAFLQSGRVGDTSCLVLDLRMPRMTGEEFLAERATVPAVPVVAVSATADPATRIRLPGVAAVHPKPAEPRVPGVAAVHPKPAEPRALLATVQRVLADWFRSPVP